MKEIMTMQIEAPAFAGVRESLNKVLNTVFKKMTTRDSDEAAITLEIKIKLNNMKTEDIKTGQKIDVKNPEIRYNVKHKLDYKSSDAEQGSIQNADGYLTCVDGSWQIRPIEDG